MTDTLTPTYLLDYSRGRNGEAKAHRTTCSRGGVRLPLSAELVRTATPGSCCKPSGGQLEDDKGQAYARDTRQGRPVHRVWAGECPACGATSGQGHGCTLQERSQGTAELAGGDVQPLPVLAGKRGGKGSAKTGDPRADRAATTAPAVHAGPAAQLDTDGQVLPMNASAYPEVTDGALRCLGACGQHQPAARFPFTASKGDGKGRYIECGACQRQRLAANKERRSAGQEPLARPRATTVAG